MSRDLKSYREGVMAERRRVILLALAHRNQAGNPSDLGHELAHKIAKAGEYLPITGETDDPEEWSSFGERKHVREVPSFMESTQSVFTEMGKRRIQSLEDQIQGRPASYYVRRIEEQDEIICGLRAELGNTPKKITELEDLVDLLRRQLSGVIG